MPYYGLDNLDELISRHVNLATGYFVELGAHDGVTQNNTLHFEQKGWRGVLVEPIPQSFEACRLNRPLAKVYNCACVREGFADTEIEMISLGLMSLLPGSIDGGKREEEWVSRGENLQQIQREKVRVPARTLDSILADAGLPRLDLFVLDVEGAELEVLGGFSLDRWNPRWLVCEDSYNDSLIDYFAERGYSHQVLLERKFTRDILYQKSGV